MFQLNPHGMTDAWWQHLLMVAVAALLGYIIGHRSGISQSDHYKLELLRLKNILDHCKKGLSARSSDGLSAMPVVPKASNTKLEDLKVVEGIGPKIEKLLQEAGIHNLYALSIASPERLQEILEAAGPQFRMHEPQTWPQQAGMAHQGKWEALKAWQDELSGGKLE